MKNSFKNHKLNPLSQRHSRQLNKFIKRIKYVLSRCEEAFSRRGDLLSEADITTLVARGRRLPRHFVPRNDSGRWFPLSICCDLCKKYFSLYK